ncbi:MAG: hypothetical protein AAGD86_06640 [Pseudomonadota bacterium]
MKRLLIAHNRSWQRRILQASLARCGYEVSEAGSRAEAEQFLYSAPPDALLVDADLDGDAALPMCEAFVQAAGDAAPLICVLARRIDAPRDALWRQLPGALMVDMPPSARVLSRQIEQHFGDARDDA